MNKSGRLPATEPRLTVRLSDGSIHEVDERQYYAITKLQQIADEVAIGAPQNLSVVLIDRDGRTNKTLVTFTGEVMDQMAAALSEQCKLASKEAARWQGTLRMGTSFTEH